MGSMGVWGYDQHLYLVVVAAPTMSNVACYGHKCGCRKRSHPPTSLSTILPQYTRKYTHYPRNPSVFRKLGTGISTHALRAHK